MKTSRRLFFTSDIVKKLAELGGEMKAAFREGEGKTGYFSSFESCYPLVSEYAYFVDDEVKSLGINTEGLSSEQVAEIIYSAAHKKQQEV